jgi:hypothetical protein
VLELAEATLRKSWTEGERRGVPFAYTRPSPGHYHWQWYWDSCFHAIVWRRFAPERPALELRSLLDGGAEDGFIPHTIFWDRPVDWRRRWTYNITSRRAPSTSTIQPPLLAWAWRIAVGDPAAEPRIAAHHRWLEANRDLDGDGLLWIVQPDESGLDSSPKFDPVWGRRAHAHLGFIALIQRNRRRGWDARRILEAGGPLLCEVVVNVLWGLARLAAGEPSITQALVERCWDERRGLFLDVARGRVARERETDELAGDRRIRTSTWSALAPLALPDLPESIGRRLLHQHLLDPGRYWTPYPLPSVSVRGATGAGRPGSTRPGWSGSGCCGSATASTRRRWRRRSAGPTPARARASSTSPSPARGSERASSAGRPGSPSSRIRGPWPATAAPAEPRAGGAGPYL